jgi:hypothetical protein
MVDEPEEVPAEEQAPPEVEAPTLDDLQRAVDAVQDEIVGQQAASARLIEETARIEAAIAKMRPPVDTPPPVKPNPPTIEPWWLKLGGPSLSGRTFRSGTFAVMGSELKAWATAMGFPPEIAGGNCTGYGSGRWIADTWEKIAVQQADIANHPQTRDCVLGLNGLSKRTWLVLMFATLPILCDLDEMIASAKGQRASHHKRLGENFRKALEKAGRDPALTIARPDWEGWGQDTARRIKAPGRIQNFLLAGGSIELDKDHMRAFARAFWDGFGMEMPIAFSDSFQTSPGVPRPAYERWLEAGIYKLACGSFHPTAERTKTQQLAWQMVHGEHTGNYTPRVIIEAAKKLKMPVAFLEHSCPPEPGALKPSIKWLGFSYVQFGHLCNNPANNVAFSCVLGGKMASEKAQAKMGEPISSEWAEGAREFRRWFGKKIA